MQNVKQEELLRQWVKDSPIHDHQHISSEKQILVCNEGLTLNTDELLEVEPPIIFIIDIFFMIFWITS